MILQKFCPFRRRTSAGARRLRGLPGRSWILLRHMGRYCLRRWPWSGWSFSRRHSLPLFVNLGHPRLRVTLQFGGELYVLLAKWIENFLFPPFPAASARARSAYNLALKKSPTGVKPTEGLNGALGWGGHSSQRPVERGAMQPTEGEATPGFGELWPALPQAEWSESCATLQLWMQVIGKVRLALTPAVNHTWNVTLYPTVRGLTTSVMPHGGRMLEIDFDFLDHLLLLRTSDGGQATVVLRPMTVAAFYGEVMAALDGLGTPVRIWRMPVEIAQAVPFDQDFTHQAYDREYVQRFWRVLLQATRVFAVFRARFI